MTDRDQQEQQAYSSTSSFRQPELEPEQPELEPEQAEPSPLAATKETKFTPEKSMPFPKSSSTYQKKWRQKKWKIQGYNTYPCKK